MVRWFRTSGCSLFYFRFLTPSWADHLLPMIHYALFKMADKGKQNFTRNNELKGKRLQKILSLGKASCGLKNRGEILVDTCVHDIEVVLVVNTSMCVLIKSVSRLFKTWLFKYRYTLLRGVVARDCSSLCLHFFFCRALLVLILSMTN